VLSSDALEGLIVGLLVDETAGAGVALGPVAVGVQGLGAIANGTSSAWSLGWIFCHIAPPVLELKENALRSH
jgi:hypothetical protein